MKKLSCKDYYIEKELSEKHLKCLFVMELSRICKQYNKLSDNCQYLPLIFSKLK